MVADGVPLATHTQPDATAPDSAISTVFISGRPVMDIAGGIVPLHAPVRCESVEVRPGGGPQRPGRGQGDVQGHRRETCVWTIFQSPACFSSTTVIISLDGAYSRITSGAVPGGKTRVT